MNLGLMLRTVRYWVEIFSLPFFIYLVIHLSGHGAVVLVDGDHESHDSFAESQEHHSDEASNYDDVELTHQKDMHHSSGTQDVHSEYISEELLFGTLFLLVFIWIWHRKGMRRLVPCTHEHCHSHILILVHVFAIFAFTALFRQWDFSLAAHILSGDAVFAFKNVFRKSFCDDFTAMHACARPDIN